MSEPKRFEDYPLRARKRARTRVRLVQALLPRLRERRLDEVSVAELCEEAEISQGTFFNYFPTKEDLLTHYVQLWSLKVGLVAREAERAHKSPLRAIEALFAATAEEVAQNPGVMLEIIAHQARMPAAPQVEPVERVERLLYLDDAVEVEALPDTGLRALLPPWLAQAAARGELAPDTDLQALLLAVSSVFFGVPLLVGRAAPEQVGPLYLQQLRLLWGAQRKA